MEDIEYSIVMLDENDQPVWWETKEGVVSGDDTIITESDAVVTPLSGDVRILYDGTSWKKVAYWKEGDTPEFGDFNGAVLIDMELPFKLQFKTADNTESVIYSVEGKGKFLFHEDGTWEKLK